jgi:acetyltransferase
MYPVQQFKDPSQNYILRHPRTLDAIFRPKTVAVIGAKDDPGSVGRTILTNLKATPFPGKVFPINPKRTTVLGQICYPDLKHLPEPVDLAIIVTPAKTVPALIEECVDAQVKSCIIISAGFKELGEPGQKLEEEIRKHSQKAEMPIIGPNCLGVMNPSYGLNATFATGMALKGHVAFISQSGAMCTSVLDWSFKEKVGFSAFVSVGSMLDVDWGDLLDYLGGETQTHSILMYMETVGDSRKFLSAAREIALEKPIIVIKAGRTEQAAQAAASHTGSLAGSDAVFDAALERVGVLRVNTIAELFQMASVLARQPRPKGPNLTIITNAGGPGVLACDAVIEAGAALTALDEKAMNALNGALPAAWSHGNPIDILGDAGPDRFAKTLEIAAQDEDSDGVLVILTPQDMTDPTASAEALTPYAKLGKPLLASWMGGTSVEKGIQILSQAQIPAFEYPDAAAATFAAMWRYSKNIQALYQMPRPSNGFDLLDSVKKMQKEEAQAILKRAVSSNQILLDEFESKKVLEGYGIPIVATQIAITEDEAATLAKQIGFPCVLKLFSKTITHKTDVGGVKLNLKDEEAVKEAFRSIRSSLEKKTDLSHFQGVTVQPMVARKGYELIIGSSSDPQFGPIILFGWGGELVEVFKDRAIGLPPLNHTLARFLMEKTKIYTALKGVRGRKGIDLHALENILIHFSDLIVENPRIKECDINPLLASEEGLIALDARIVLYSEKESEIAQLAIRPYPSQYVHTWTLKNGLPVLIRPIMPEDESQIVAFHKELSEHSVRQRFFEFVSLDARIARMRLVQICFNNFDREIALVAESTQDPKIIAGVIRITRIPSTQNGQLTMIILDAYHHQGLGSHLLNTALDIAKNENIAHIQAYILDENKGMIHMCRKARFQIAPSEKAHILKASLALK